MKLDDIAKMAIDEVALELKEINEVNSKSNLSKLESRAQPIKTFDIDATTSGEQIFLKNLKERILVLFDGLSATPSDELQNRLDLTLKFLEFVLANVENRLIDLQK